MPIKIIAADTPKPGDRVQPLNDERYYFITRINRDRAYYRWEPEEDSQYIAKREDRYVPLDLLKADKVGSLVLWREQHPTPEMKKEEEQKNNKTRHYHAKLNWHGQVYEADTVAPTDVKAKTNFMGHFARLFNVTPAAVTTYVKNKPTSFELEECKE